MWKPVLALLASGALAVPVAAPLAEGDATPAPAPATPSPTVDTSAPPCTPAKRAFALKHWRRAHPARGRNVCKSDGLSKLRERFFEYRLYRRVAPFRFPGGHGPPSPGDGRYFAIPWQVVCGESRGNFTVNADGAYQIIPSTWAAYGGTRFAPTAGAATPLEQHIIAHRAYGHTAWYGYSTGC